MPLLNKKKDPNKSNDHFNCDILVPYELQCLSFNVFHFEQLSSSALQSKVAIYMTLPKPREFKHDFFLAVCIQLFLHQRDNSCLNGEKKILAYFL